MNETPENSQPNPPVPNPPAPDAAGPDSVQPPAPAGYPTQPPAPAYPGAAPVEPHQHPVPPAAQPAPAAPAYPAAAPVDPNAYPAQPAYPAAPVDPNAYPAAPVDPNAYPAQPTYPAAPVDPNAYAAAPVDPNAYQGAYAADPSVYPGAAPVDPNAYPAAPVDPNAYPAAPVDPNAYQGAYPAAPVDPNAYQGAYAADPNAYPADPNGYPVYPGAPVVPAPKKPMSKGLLFGIIGGGAALLLIIVAAIVVPILLRAPVASASDFVEGYLTAVADGDAKTALTYVDANGDDDLLTDDVLKASLELGAIGDIELGEEGENEYGNITVPASFSIGDEKFERTFEVYRSYEGDLELVDGLVRFSGPYGFEGLDLTVNGAAMPEYTYVFPGTYQLAIGVDAFAIDGETVFVIADNGDDEALYDVSPMLSESGTATFRELVGASFNECLAMKTLDTPCGMNTSTMTQDGYTPIDGTVTRTIDAEAQATIANLKPSVSEHAIVKTYDYWSVDITLDASNGSSTSQFEVLFGGQVLTPKVDFAAETPTVIWE